ncbi:UPF0764 protein C16orf89 homolog isoform X2 [Pteropus vampyrus]|uniref:UPF0764 protein C16orf89 homolog isoform X2 n=1 Tax=Pteropus vampyrus TaxID=132908 RepID=A0A6P3RBU4_PTEVA|nr:UPF0764 protein C16orf89 homolog isoform X2 [Pteropus vampyrus]
MSIIELLLLLLLLAPPLKPSSLPPLDTPEGKVTITGLILSSIERATSFLKKRLPEINLDGIVGFRVLEEFQPTIQPGFWKLPHVWMDTNTSMVYSKFELEDSFSEEHSDLCLVQLLGTGTDSGQPCRLSDFCRTLMTKPGCSGYCLSHQLLFFLLARMKGCTRGLFRQSQHYMNLFCANMMDLNWRAEAIGYAYPTRDIFTENILFCGISGFSDFYKLRWLEAILSWQKPQEGCFGRPDAEDEELSKAIQHQQHYLRRVKRREKQFADGCSSHNTAMAVGALGGFLYILAQYPPANRELQQATPAPPTDTNGSTPATQEDKIHTFHPSFLES